MENSRIESRMRKAAENIIENLEAAEKSTGDLRDDVSRTHPGELGCEAKADVDKSLESAEERIRAVAETVRKVAKNYLFTDDIRG